MLKYQNEVCDKFRKEFERISMQYELDTGKVLAGVAIFKHDNDFVVSIEESWVPPVKMVSNWD